MGKPVYITNPEVAAHYSARAGEWFFVPDDLEADWLVGQRHAYSLAAVEPIPAVGFVHPEAPAPFRPYLAKATTKPAAKPKG